MKNIKYFSLLMMIAFFSACSSKIEVRDLPGNLPETDITIDATDPNQPLLTVSDETVFTANWDFGNGILLQGKTVQGFFPLKGEYQYTITAINGAGSTTAKGTITVENSNPGLVYGIPEYAALVGKEGDGGKYWVFDQSAPGGDVSYMTADYDWTEFWWNPYGGEDGTSLPDYMNEMKFDLEGGFNYTRDESKGVELEKGSFVLNIPDMTLQFVNANIPNYNDPNLSDDVISTGIYQIKSINERELILWQEDATNGYGWTWKFKARDVTGDSPLYKLTGKTWIYDQSNVTGDIGYCYMTARYDWNEAWWNPYENGTPSKDINNEMEFTTHGEFIRYESEGVEAERGTFTLDNESLALKIMNAMIPDGDDSYLGDDKNLNPEATATGEYQIQVLSDTELLIWQIQYDTGNDDDDYAWAWKFKVKE